MAECPACRSLAAVGLQCNHHRRTAPNARTKLQRRMVAHMAATGATAAETEATFGVTEGPAIGGGLA